MIDKDLDKKIKILKIQLQIACNTVQLYLSHADLFILYLDGRQVVGTRQVGGRQVVGTRLVGGSEVAQVEQIAGFTCFSFLLTSSTTLSVPGMQSSGHNIDRCDIKVQISNQNGNRYGLIIDHIIHFSRLPNWILFHNISCFEQLKFIWLTWYCV